MMNDNDYEIPSFFDISEIRDRYNLFLKLVLLI